jgi:hypothetical protein
VGLEAGHLVRVVGHEPDALDTEIGEDPGRAAVLAPVDGQPERRVRRDRVQTLVLERVGPELVGQSDAAALLSEVQQDTSALGGDRRQRSTQLLPTVAPQRAQDVAGPALRVEADERRVRGAEIPVDQRDRLGAVPGVREDDCLEVADARRQGGVGETPDSGVRGRLPLARERGVDSP